MDSSQRLQLQNLISTNQVEDTTDLIRTLKHSHILRSQINELVSLVAMYLDGGSDIDSDPSTFQWEAMTKCHFLFTYYTDLYNKIKNHEIDMAILYNALDVLHNIEEGNLDQHEGAFEFGQLLKEIYIDSALKKAEKLNRPSTAADAATAVATTAAATITWSQFKSMNRNQKTKRAAAAAASAATRLAN